MKLKTIYLVLVAVLTASLSSCGIFHKDCGCPHFGMIKKPVENAVKNRA